MGLLHAAMDKATTNSRAVMMQLCDSVANGSQEVGMATLCKCRLGALQSAFMDETLDGIRLRCIRVGPLRGLTRSHRGCRPRAQAKTCTARTTKDVKNSRLKG